MPLELGLFLGCKRFGQPPQRKKACLILDSDKYRYRNFISDISGQDIHAHDGDPKKAIVEVRDWLRSASRRKIPPGGQAIAERHAKFQAELLELCTELNRQRDSLTFVNRLVKADFHNFGVTVLGGQNLSEIVRLGRDQKSMSSHTGLCSSDNDRRSFFSYREPNAPTLKFTNGNGKSASRDLQSSPSQNPSGWPKHRCRITLMVSEEDSVGSVLYDFLTESFLFKVGNIDSGFAGSSDDVLLKELQRYRKFCTENLSQLESEAAPSQSSLRVFSGRRSVDLQLLKQSALYIEQYVIADPLFPFSSATTRATEAFQSHIGLPGPSALDRVSLRKCLRFLKDITPFIAADYVKLLPVSLLFEPPDEIPLYYSENQFEDVLPPDLLKFFCDRCVTQSLRRTDEGLVVEDTLSVARSIITTFEGHHPFEPFGQALFEQRFVSCDEKAGTFKAVQYLPDTLPSEGEFHFWVRQSENRAAINFYNQLRTELAMGARLGASYLTQSPFVSDLLTRFFPREPQSSTATHTTNIVLNVDLPFLDAISIENLMNVRQNDGEVFQNFRNELESRLFEVRLESDPERRRVKAEKAFHDLGVVQVHALEVKAKDLARSSAAQAVVAVATFMASVTTAHTPLVPVAAIAGLAKVLYDYRSNTRANPAFFLWKAKSS